MFALACYFLLGKCVKNKKGDRKKKERERRVAHTKAMQCATILSRPHTLLCIAQVFKWLSNAFKAFCAEHGLNQC